MAEEQNATFQTNAYQRNSSGLTNYALFLGGLNVTRHSLEQYDPLITGYGRIFMVRTPIFVRKQLQSKMKQFKHILEYANTGVSGNQDIELSFVNMQGGYTNRQVDIPTIASDTANELTIKTYEFSGSPVREILQYWINGISDIQSGYTTYNGLAYLDNGDDALEAKNSNHSAEFIYVHTDRTGQRVEYAALWANCIPKRIQLSHFDYESGQHELVPMDIVFSGVRYMSPQINNRATQLLAKYNTLYNSLNFHSGLTEEFINKYGGRGKFYDMNTGKLVEKADVGIPENQFVYT